MSDITNKPSPRRFLWTTIVLLVLVWAVISGLRYFDGDSGKATTGDSFWQVNINVQIMEPVKPGVVAIAAVPEDTDHIRVVGQNLVYPGWRVRFVSDPDWGIGRKMRLESISSGTRGFELGFTIRQSAVPLMQHPSSLGRKLSSKSLERYLRNDSLLDLENDALVNEINQLAGRSISNSALLSLIFKRAQQLAPSQGTSGSRNIPEVITSGRANPLERAYVMVALCRAVHIPARLVTGLELTETRETRLHYWVEVYETGKGWLSYDPLHGYQMELPDNFLPFVKDRADLVDIKTSNRITVGYAISGREPSLDYFTSRNTGWQSIFFLTRLPLETRNVLAHLLLLPLAVLLTTLFRTLSGVRSYGTYMPALFALSWVYADWRMATITMCLVLLFAILGRSALPVKLNRQPRLTTVLILVILAVAATISLMDYIQGQQEGKVLLLPVVITAILVDLFYKAFEKEGPVSAFTRLVWTMVQVAICLPVMQFESLGHWLVAHPESHLLTLAATLSIMGFRGRNLADLLK